MMNFNIIQIFYKNIFIHITSSDLSKLYTMGFVLTVLFCLQIVSGMLLSFLYNNSFNNCWYSILSMIDWEGGYIMSSTHMTNTSIMFFFLYLHMIKMMLHLMIHNTSVMVFMWGLLVYLLTVVIAFLGYVLPLTQMSYWGLVVFSNMLSTIPYIGMLVTYWVWSSEFMTDFTIMKVHSMHVFLPFILIFFIVLHIFFLHYYLSSDVTYDRFNFYYEKMYFSFFYLFRDLFMFFIILLFYMYFIIMYWIFVFHEESFIMVNSLSTSEKIMPEWFFLFYFGFIKAVPDKLIGIVMLVTSIVGMLLSMFFILSTFMFFNYSILNIYNNLLIIFCLYFMSMLSTNVTLLFPLMHELQLLVLFILFLTWFKLL